MRKDVSEIISSNERETMFAKAGRPGAVEAMESGEKIVAMRAGQAFDALVFKHPVDLASCTTVCISDKNPTVFLFVPCDFPM